MGLSVKAMEARQGQAPCGSFAGPSTGLLVGFGGLSARIGANPVFDEAVQVAPGHMVVTGRIQKDGQAAH